MNPKIRFKKEDGSSFDDYSMVKIGTLASKIQSGGTPKSSCKEYYDGDIKFLSISDMTKAGKYIKTTEKFLTEAGINNSSAWVVPKRSVLLSMYASYGKACINEEEVATSQAILAIIPANNNAEYLYQLLTHLQQENFWDAYIKSGTQPNLSKAVIENTVVSVPELEEQQKIAAFFTALDESIDICDKKLILFEKIRDSITNKLLTNAVSSSSKLHKGDEISRVKIKEISEFVTVGIANAARHAYCDCEEGIPLLRNMNIKANKLDDSDLVYITHDFANKYKNKVLKENDIIVCRTGEPGTACLVTKKFDGAQTFTTLIIRLKKDCCPEYVCRYMNSKEAKKYIESTTIGGGQKNSGAGIIGEMPIDLPTIEVQKKIADVLLCVDNKVNVQRSRLKCLKRLKRSIMQQMFV